MINVTDDEYQGLSKILQDLTGIFIPDSKRYLFSSRLSSRLTDLKLSGLSAYIKFLQTNNAKEIENFINCMTTNLSYFFREPHHFKSIVNAFNNKKHTPFRIGSFACSTGEEAVSAAISLFEAGAKTGSFEIIANDIDTEIIQQAKSGTYPPDKIATIDSHIKSKYFKLNNGSFTVDSQILSTIKYQTLNLVKSQIPFPVNHFDVILCRNALIYFPVATQKAVTLKLLNHIKPGGLLCLGHAELLTETHSTLTFLGQSTYSKK